MAVNEYTQLNQCTDNINKYRFKKNCIPSNSTMARDTCGSVQQQST